MEWVRVMTDISSCEFQGINSDLAQDFCWIHGTSYIPPQYQPHLKCIVELEGVESEDDAPDTAYYQVRINKPLTI